MVKKYVAILLMMILVGNSALALTTQYYELNLIYNGGDISYDLLKVKPLISDRNLDNYAGGYVAETVSFENKILNITFFSIPLIIISETYDSETGFVVGGITTILNETQITLMLPYFENAKEINIYDENITKVLTIDVGDYSQIKPTKIKKEEIIEEVVTKPKEEVKVGKIKDKNYYLFYILLLSLAILIIIYLIKKGRKT